MIECTECGEIFNKNELIRTTEVIERFMGDVLYGYHDVCPYCRCEDCFEEYYEEEDEE